MIQEVFTQWWNETKEHEYFNYVAAGLVVIALVVGGWKGHEWHVTSREEKAQLAFSDALDEFHMASYIARTEPEEKAKIADHLKDATLAFSTVLEKHSSATLAPYAKGFLAEIHLLKDEPKEALALFQEVTNDVGSNSPLYFLYQTKIALLQLSLGEEKEGVDHLQTLAHNTANIHSDNAAYFLGQYYWTKGESKKAAQEWDRFLEKNQPKDPLKASPWAQGVQAKLGELS